MMRWPRTRRKGWWKPCRPNGRGRFDAMQQVRGPRAGRRRLEIAAQPGTPGIRGATVDFDLTQAGGKGKLRLRDGAIDVPGVFEEPVIAVRRALGRLAMAGQWRGNIGFGRQPQVQQRRCRRARARSAGAPATPRRAFPACWTCRPASAAPTGPGSIATCRWACPRRRATTCASRWCKARRQAPGSGSRAICATSLSRIRGTASSASRPRCAT